MDDDVFVLVWCLFLKVSVVEVCVVEMIFGDLIFVVDFVINDFVQLCCILLLMVVCYVQLFGYSGYWELCVVVVRVIMLEQVQQVWFGLDIMVIDLDDGLLVIVVKFVVQEIDVIEKMVFVFDVLVFDQVVCVIVVVWYIDLFGQVVLLLIVQDLQFKFVCIGCFVLYLVDLYFVVMMVVLCILGDVVIVFFYGGEIVEMICVFEVF